MKPLNLILKRSLKVFPFLMVFIAVIYGCKKTDDLERSEPLKSLTTSVQDAKNWYENAYPKIDVGKLHNTVAGTDYSQILSPDWTNSNSYTRFDDDVLEISMSKAIQLGVVFKSEVDKSPVLRNNYSKSSYLLLRQGDNYKAYIMTVIADPIYLSGDLTKLNLNKYNKRDSAFSGSIVYLTPKGEFVSAWVFDRGEITSQVKKNVAVAESTQKIQNSKIKTDLVQQVCKEWYYYTYYQKDDGTYSEPEAHYGGKDCYYVDLGGTGGGSVGGGGNGGSGGGSGGGTTTPSVPQTPCNPVTAVESAPKHQALTLDAIKVNKVDPTGGDGGFPPPEQIPCPPTPPEGFRPLCKGSIVVQPYNKGSSQINMAGATFGIMDMPHFPLFKTQINVIEFNLFVSIPNNITNPNDRTKTISFTADQQRQFIYQAYHYASEMTNAVHGQDFFSVNAQPKYSVIFAGFVEQYLNTIALQGMFPTFESQNGIPSLGARASTLINPSLATPANYTDGKSGEGC